jgi:hypothetical protein
MTRRERSPWWTPFRFCRESADARVTVRIVLWVTADMMSKQFGKVYATEASSLFLQSAIPNTAVDWADVGGSWNEPSPG